MPSNFRANRDFKIFRKFRESEQLRKEIPRLREGESNKKIRDFAPPHPEILRDHLDFQNIVSIKMLI